MNALDKEYIVKCHFYTKESWYELMEYFDDANLYQSWSYDMVRYGHMDLAHMVLKKNGMAIAAAQARIVRLFRGGPGIGYIRWGPMWQSTEGGGRTEVFRQAVRGLRNEFSVRRRLVLRLYPLAFRGKDEALEGILLEEGYHPLDEGKADRTLIINLKPSLDELRAALDQKWRNSLNRAEKNGLDIQLGEEEGLFDEIAKIYMEMVERKGLRELSDINHLKMVQRDLPEDLKLKVILCRLDGELCAGGIFSAIGETGVYLVGATSDKGLKANGSYLVQWAFVKWLKDNEFKYYDLNGINPEINPGTYRFKRGLAGKRGMDVEFLGKFQVADSRLSDWVVRGGEGLLSAYRRMFKSGRTLLNILNTQR